MTSFKQLYNNAKDAIKWMQKDFWLSSVLYLKWILSDSKVFETTG